MFIKLNLSNTNKLYKSNIYTQKHLDKLGLTGISAFSCTVFNVIKGYRILLYKKHPVSDVRQNVYRLILKVAIQGNFNVIIQLIIYFIIILSIYFLTIFYTEVKL